MENLKKISVSGVSSEDTRCAPFSVTALEHVLMESLQLEHTTPLVVAYSGGHDSHVLLHSIARTKRPVRALHIDHGLQTQSAAWAVHCQKICHAMGLPCTVERVIVKRKLGLGLEAAARQARYAALARLLEPGEVLLAAHHQDDQAETLLLQLLRGAGVHGLAAMRSIAPFPPGRLARPLLGFSRAALADYANLEQLRWIDDATNNDVRLRRNYLRREILPILTRHWPRVKARLAVSAQHAAETVELMDEIAALDRAQCERGGALSLSEVAKLSPVRQVNLLRGWIRACGYQSPPEPALQRMLEQVQTCPRSRQALIRWSNIEVRRYRDRLIVRRCVESAVPDWEQPWDITKPLLMPGTNRTLVARPNIGAGIAREFLAGKHLQVRLRKGGEFFRLRGHRRSVKKLMQEAGIPPWERGLLPFVYVGNDLVAVGDQWICEPYAAKPGEPGWVLSFVSAIE